MKSSNLLKHFSIIGIGSIISLLLGFFNTPIITRLVDPTEYGQYSLFLTYSNVIVSIIYLGFDQSFIRYYYNENEFNYKQALLWNCIKVPLVAYFIVAFIGLVNNHLIGELLSLNVTVMIFIIVYVLIQIIYRFSSLVLRLEFKSKIFSSLEIIQKIVYLTCALSLLLFSVHKESYVLMFAFVLSYFIVMVFSIIAGKSIWKLKMKNIKKVKISTDKLAKYAIPMVFSVGVTSLFNANDKLFLQYYTSLEELGIYSSATSLIVLVSVVQRTFNTVWSPASIEHYTNKPNDKTFYVKGFSVISILMIFLAISVILFKDFIAVLLGPAYREAAYVLPMLILGPVLFTISETTVGGIVFSEKSHYHIIVAVSAFVFDIGSKFLLVPWLGVKGAALSTALSHFIIFTLRTFIANRLYYVDYNLKKFYLIFFCVFIYALYSMFNSFNIVVALGYVLIILLMFICYKKTFSNMWGEGISQIKKVIDKR